MTGGSTIRVESLSTDAGSVSVTTGNDLILESSQITARAGGDGGNIALSTLNFIILDESQLVAEAANNGGNIVVGDARFALMDQSVITANAVLGDGGFIQVGTEVLLTNESAITASSQFGADGTVRIDAISNLSETQADLDDEVLDENDQLAERCTVRIPGERSSFILVGCGSPDDRYSLVCLIGCCDLVGRLC